MSDELTPEELDALKNLPRERMPSAGLEDRVVGAMRARGVLAPRRARVVRITHSRVAGLLAACLVLMIGAYSIGLHRGGDNEVLRSVQEPSGDTSRLLPTDETAPMAVRESFPESAPLEKQVRNIEPELEWKLKTNEGRVDAAPAPRGGRSDADIEKQAIEAGEGLASKDEARSGTLERQYVTPAPSAARLSDALQPSAKVPAQSKALSAEDATRRRTFTLGGSVFIVDAPDSVRIVEDETGRVLLIYTSDGIIRIRLAD